MTRSAHIRDRALVTELASERSHLDTYTRAVAGAAGCPPLRRSPPDISHTRRSHRRRDRRPPGATQLLPQPEAKRAVDRWVLPPGSCRRGPGSDPIRLTEQIALRKRLPSERRTDHDASIGVPLPHRGRLEDLDGLNHLLTGGQLELQLGHAPRLSPKPAISGQIKRGRKGHPPASTAGPSVPRVRKTGVFRPNALQPIRELPFSLVSATGAPQRSRTIGRENSTQTPV